MEQPERAHIRDNLVELVKNTIVSKLLLAILQQTGVLGDNDVQLIEAEKTQFAQSMELYKLLETRVNAYEALRNALIETNQSGALAVLPMSRTIRYNTSPERPTSTGNILGSHYDTPKHNVPSFGAPRYSTNNDVPFLSGPGRDGYVHNMNIQPGLGVLYPPISAPCKPSAADVGKVGPPIFRPYPTSSYPYPSGGQPSPTGSYPFPTSPPYPTKYPDYDNDKF